MSRREYQKATEEDLASLSEAARLLGEYPTLFVSTLEMARLMKSTFEAWAWMGDLNLDMLNRQGGPETIRLAHEINRIGKDLN